MSRRVGAFRVFLLAWNPLQYAFLQRDSEGTDQENLQGLSWQWLSTPVFSGPAIMNSIYNFASLPMCSLCFIHATAPVSYIIMDFSVEFLLLWRRSPSFVCVYGCVHKQVRSQLQWLFLRCFPPYFFLRQGLSLALGSPSKLGWLTSNLQRSVFS